MPSPAWTLDPDDPRAPPEDVWDALSPAERERIVASPDRRRTRPLVGGRLPGQAR